VKIIQAKFPAGSVADPEQESCTLWQSAEVGEQGEHQQTQRAGFGWDRVNFLHST